MGDREVPPGWNRAPIRGDEIVFRHQRECIGVEAAKTSSAADSERDVWELKVMNEAEGHTIIRPFGTVSSREAAINALFSCMHAINAVAGDERDSLTIVNEIQLKEQM